MSTAIPDLIGEEVTLKAMTVEDISDEYLGWLNDPDVNQFLEIRFTPQTFETVQQYLLSFFGSNEQYFGRSE